MLRALIVAIGLLSVFGGPVLAQTNFDATGQFTLSFKLSHDGKQKEKPRLGFRFGASNVPQVRIEENDPTRSGLQLDFDRHDSTIQSFAGVGVEFGEADDKTIRLLDDPFSASSLGLVSESPAYGQDAGRIADYLRGNRNSDDGSAWSLSTGQPSGFGWNAAPLSD